MRPDFADLLQPAQMQEALRDLHAALRDLASCLADGSAAAAHKAHDLITYAIVFGLYDLEDRCRTFERAAVDRDDIGAARRRLLIEIERTLADAQLKMVDEP